VLNGRKRIGVWKYFYADGSIISQENYKDGLQIGAQLVKYQNCKVTE
jgi:antitoxin component YwqK of YwqJK toxin-antitoxin module